MSSLTPEEEAVRQHGSKAAAARALGIAPTTLKDRLHQAQRPPRPPPDTPPEISPAKPVIRIKAVTTETALNGPIRKVVAIGDLHDNPTRDKERFKWIGRYISEARPDNVIQIGDWLSLDSLSAHEKPGSRGYYERPNYAEDLASAEETLYYLHQEFAIGEIPCTITFGNHEYRAYRVEESSPNLKGTCYLPIQQLFARHRWDYREYGEWAFFEGVGFTHIPFNAVGRDFRGEHVENQLGPRAVFSIVLGHTHKEVHKIFPKIGPSRRIEICNLGTAMPYGEIEHYAGLSMTGWSWGIKELRLQSGHIVGHKFISMEELAERFA
jgi:transposase-like protein